jgi:hypothetical protein
MILINNRIEMDFKGFPQNISGQVLLDCIIAANNLFLHFDKINIYAITNYIMLYIFSRIIIFAVMKVLEPM